MLILFEVLLAAEQVICSLNETLLVVEFLLRNGVSDFYCDGRLIGMIDAEV